MAAACGFLTSGAGTGFAAVMPDSGPTFVILACALRIRRCFLRLALSRVLLWLMRLIPWLEEGRIAKTQGQSRPRGWKRRYSPRRDHSRPGDDGLSPMNGPQPLAPS